MRIACFFAGPRQISKKDKIEGKLKKKVKRGRGGNTKIRLMSEKSANVSTPSGKTEKVEILRVRTNPANLHYNRRGVITQGTIVETSLGAALVTSRPGQEGIINAVLITEEV